MPLKRTKTVAPKTAHKTAPEAAAKTETQPTYDDEAPAQGQILEHEPVVAEREQESVIEAAAEDDEPPFEADAEQLAADTQAAKDKAAAAEERKAKAAAAAERKAKAALEGRQVRAEITEAKPLQAAPVGNLPVASSGKGDAILSGLQEEGYEGLNLGFGSFPIMKLENEGIFCDTEDNEYGKEFDCLIYPTKQKYVLKNTKVEDKKDEEAHYSYDMVVEAETNTPLADIIAEWEIEGWGHEIKPYLEAPAQLVGGDFDGEMVMLSIPPASKNALSGHFYKQAMAGRGTANEYVTKCFVGKKVTSTAHAFYPWKFKFVGMYVEE